MYKRQRWISSLLKSRASSLETMVFASATLVGALMSSTSNSPSSSAVSYTHLDAVARGVAALRQGVPIVTDTNMAKAGVSLSLIHI